MSSLNRQQVLHVGDSNDTLPAAPAQRLDAAAEDNLHPKGQAEELPVASASKLDHQQLFPSVLTRTRFSGPGIRSTSNKDVEQVGAQAAKGFIAWKAKQQTEKATIETMSSSSPGGHSSVDGITVSFVTKRMQQKKASVPPDNSLVQGMRRNMREQLLKRLTKSNLVGEANTIANQPPEVQTAFAQRLEEVLFKTSKSVVSYANPNTLDRRLQALLAAMQKRKAKKSDVKPPASAAKSAIQQQQASSKASSDTVTITSKRSLVEQQKRDVLRGILGQDKMNRVFKVVAEIKLIQLGRKVTEGKPYEPFPQCTKSGCSFLVPCPGDQKAPKVVRDLFFNTAIITAYEKTSPGQLASLPWDQLLAQGEARLSAYHDWFRQRQAAFGSKKPLTSLP